MRRLLQLFLFLMTLGMNALAADHLEGVLPLAKDDIAAVAQVKAAPDRHVLLYFGDHLN